MSCRLRIGKPGNAARRTAEQLLPVAQKVTIDVARTTAIQRNGFADQDRLIRSRIGVRGAVFGADADRIRVAVDPGAGVIADVLERRRCRRCAR